MAVGIGRRQFVAGLGGAAMWPLAARAQQPMPVIGLLSGLSPAVVARNIAGFLQGLNEAGYIEGQNVAIEYRWAEGQYDRLPALAADLVRRQVAVIFAACGDPSALAAKATTSTIPIVFIVGRDPVKIGLVASLNRPGANATGVNFFIAEMDTKRVELLRELVPTAITLAVLINPKNGDAEVQLSEVQSAARALGHRIEIIYASSSPEIDTGFASLMERKIGGLLVAADPFFNNRRDQIISLASHYSMPAIYFVREFADSGGLISYGTNLTDAYRQVGVYAGKILSGSNPADLPVVQPTKIELVINLKTAKTLGIVVPNSLLATADDVIE
jgi:putative tryptophan/tyrosine transport system substrate-binding protein